MFQKTILPLKSKILDVEDPVYVRILTEIHTTVREIIWHKTQVVFLMSIFDLHRRDIRLEINEYGKS